MKRTGRRIIAWMTLATVAVAMMPRSALALPSQRFALLIANNDGGPGTERLRYAEDDAAKMQSVLTELGGYQNGNIVSLLGRSSDEVLSALDAMNTKIIAAKNEKRHTTLLLYYSGHAKAGALRMGTTQLGMKQLRMRLTGSAADVRIGVIDSCESGAITREKGGRRGPSFLFDVDDREAAKGLILISSSSANESSQESDDLAGSFFTHYLSSGLRGDADESGDQRVTLGEVYEYAYHRTVAITANTRSGTQHPTYSYDLKGQGDIILSDLSKGASGVLFPASSSGDYLIFDMGREQVAAEISKRPGKERRIAVPPGKYVVKKRHQDHLMMIRFDLSQNSFYMVNEGVMDKVAFEDDYAKGIAAKLQLEREEVRLTLRTIAVYQSFFSNKTRREYFPPVFMGGIAAELSAILGGNLRFEVLAGGDRDAEVTFQESRFRHALLQLQLSVGLNWRLNVGPVSLYAGPRLAGVYFRRTFPYEETQSQTQDHLGVSPGISLGAIYFPGTDRDFSIELTGRAGYMPFSGDDNRSLFVGEAGLSLGYRL